MSDSAPLRMVALGDLKHELETTRRVLARVPAEKVSWKPHDKSMSLGALSWHVANIVMWQKLILQHDEYDLATGPPSRTDDPPIEETIAHFEANAGPLQAALETADDDMLNRPWRLRFGDQVILHTTRVRTLRGFGISHMIHHRAQLTVYLRLLDVPVPSVYGPTADER